MDEIGLNDRKIFPDTMSISLEAEIDYESVNQKISNRRNEGVEYLKRALECGGEA